MRLRMLPRIAAVLVLLAGGCASDPSRGYSFASVHDERVRTVAIPIFDNLTYEPGLEAELTDAVIKEIQSSTRWRVVGQGSAAYELRGSITGADYRALTTRRGLGLVQEMAFTLRADFDFRGEGGVLVSRRGFSATESAVVAPGTGERIEIGRHAAAQELARAIVAELESSW